MLGLVLFTVTAVSAGGRRETCDVWVNTFYVPEHTTSDQAGGREPDPRGESPARRPAKMRTATHGSVWWRPQRDPARATATRCPAASKTHHAGKVYRHRSIPCPVGRVRLGVGFGWKNRRTNRPTCRRPVDRKMLRRVIGPARPVDPGRSEYAGESSRAVAAGLGGGIFWWGGGPSRAIAHPGVVGAAGNEKNFNG